MAAAYVHNLTDGSGQERALLYALIAKPLSLGDWQTIAASALDAGVRYPKPIRLILRDLCRVFSKHEIAAWRNATIGHGALGFEDDPEIRADIEAKLHIIADHLSRTADHYGSLLVFAQLDEQRIPLSGAAPSLISAAYSVTAECAGETWPLFPYVHAYADRIFFFDAYYPQKRRMSALLNYSHGKKRLQALHEMAQLHEQLMHSTRFKAISQASNDGVHSMAEADMLMLSWSESDLIEPTLLLRWLKDAIQSHGRGVFLLQLERGCGKSSFVRLLDELKSGRARIPGVSVRAHYCNDLFGYRPGNFVWSATDALRFAPDRSIWIAGEMPPLSQNAQDRRLAFAEFLGFFRQQRRRNFNDTGLLFIIDAVDETPLPIAPILDFVPRHEDLEDGVYVLVTARTTQELPGGIRDQLGGIRFTEVLSADRYHQIGDELLQGLLRGSGLAESFWPKCLELSDHRALYLRTLLNAVQFLDAGESLTLPSGSELAWALIDKLRGVYGVRHFHHLTNILAVLAFAYEPLTLEELCYLLLEPHSTIRTAAFLGDVRGLLRLDRSPRGNLLSLAHEETSRFLRTRFSEAHKELVQTWLVIAATQGDAASRRLTPEHSYIFAHIVDYQRDNGIELGADAARQLARDMVAFLSEQSDAHSLAAERARQIAVNALEVLSASRDAVCYFETASQLSSTLLIPALERRLQENDQMLPLIAAPDAIGRAESYDFYRALAVAAYRAERFNIAVQVADSVCQATGLARDLATFAIVLKGTDSTVAGSFTMARCREVAQKAIAGELRTQLPVRLRAYLLYSVGRIFSDTIENQEDAVTLLTESLRLFESEGERVAIIALRNALALADFDAGSFASAFARMNEVLRAVETLADQVPRAIRETAIVNVHVLSFLAGAEVVDLVESSELRNWELRAYHLNNRFLISITNGMDELANRLSSECLELVTERQGVYSRAAILNNIGVVFGNRVCLEQAHKICFDSGYSIGESIAATNLGFDRPVVHGVVRWTKGLLWPCLKNMDVMPEG
jgi:hypothetical protein